MTRCGGRGPRTHQQPQLHRRRCTAGAAALLRAPAPAAADGSRSTLSLPPSLLPRALRQLNSRLPGHVPAPKRADMMALCRRFDANGDGLIDRVGGQGSWQRGPSRALRSKPRPAPRA